MQCTGRGVWVLGTETRIPSRIGRFCLANSMRSLAATIKMTIPTGMVIFIAADVLIPTGAKCPFGNAPAPWRGSARSRHPFLCLRNQKGCRIGSLCRSLILTGALRLFDGTHEKCAIFLCNEADTRGRFFFDCAIRKKHVKDRCRFAAKQMAQSKKLL